MMMGIILTVRQWKVFHIYVDRRGLNLVTRLFLVFGC